MDMKANLLLEIKNLGQINIKKKYKEEIKTKLELPGSTIKGTYGFFKEKDDFERQ